MNDEKQVPLMFIHNNCRTNSVLSALCKKKKKKSCMAVGCCPSFPVMKECCFTISYVTQKKYFKNL